MKGLLLLGLIIQSSLLFAQHNHQQTSSAPSKKTTVKTVVKNEVKEEPRVKINIPSDQQQKIGLKVTTVKKMPMTITIRTVGTVTADERKEAHVHTKINGWIEKIYADYIGKTVKKGAPLYGLYSPDIVSTQEELLAAIQQPGVGKELARAASDRLKLWGVSSGEIERIKRSKAISRVINFHSPVNGTIISKNAIQGMYITPGIELYQIADLSKVWIMVTLYEYDVGVVKVGDEALIDVQSNPNLNLKAKITYISPEVDLETKTAKARLEIDNKSGDFRPGMYANISLQKILGESLVIPDDSVIDTGVRKIVFVKNGNASFEPREIKIGPRTDNQIAVLSGLKAGEEIVTSAHFLIDTESKFKAAIEKGDSSSAPNHGGH